MAKKEKYCSACGIGNGLLDVCVQVSEEQLQQLGLRKGSMTLADASAQQELLDRVQGRESAFTAGGSIANSIAVLSQLGGKGALITRTGNDRYGEIYRRDFLSLGVDLGDAQGKPGATGTCISLLTPDCQRTMQTCLGVSAELCREDVGEALIERANWLFVEGYVLINPGAGPGAVQRAVALSLESGTQIALSFSDTWLVEGQRPVLEKLVRSCSMVFCNEEEACAFTGQARSEKAFEILSGALKGVAMTAGARGAYCSWQGERVFVKGYPCSAVDTTGAGDMFAGAMLYGLCHNVDLERNLRGACWLASRVVSQRGARLAGDIKALWTQADKAG